MSLASAGGENSCEYRHRYAYARPELAFFATISLIVLSPALGLRRSVRSSRASRS